MPSKCWLGGVSSPWSSHQARALRHGQSWAQLLLRGPHLHQLKQHLMQVRCLCGTIHRVERYSKQLQVCTTFSSSGILVNPWCVADISTGLYQGQHQARLLIGRPWQTESSSA